LQWFFGSGSPFTFYPHLAGTPTTFWYFSNVCPQPALIVPTSFALFLADPLQLLKPHPIFDNHPFVVLFTLFLVFLIFLLVCSFRRFSFFFQTFRVFFLHLAFEVAPLPGSHPKIFGIISLKVLFRTFSVFPLFHPIPSPNNFGQDALRSCFFLLLLIFMSASFPNPSPPPVRQETSGFFHSHPSPPGFFSFVGPLFWEKFFTKARFFSGYFCRSHVFSKSPPDFALF